MHSKCHICFRVGWVCRSHPDRPWNDEIGCTCGPGKPCVQCNDADEPDYSGLMIEEITWH
jgi:hypothetical protein